VIGVVCLADKITGDPFDGDDLRTLTFLADHIAQALENALKYRQLRELSVVDELTGLYNRRHFQRSLEQEVQRATRYDRQITLALLDLDQFKSYNDLCGHPAGDRALTHLGEILRDGLREVDIVARYGGEEFAVILPETNARPSAGASSPFPFLERLRKSIEEAAFPGEERLPSGRLTVSGGVACFPDDADNVQSLIDAADRALYEAKEQGRNRFVYRGKRL
jgi:diguanylate cyclase (GGDEF)-like protein